MGSSHSKDTKTSAVATLQNKGFPLPLELRDQIYSYLLDPETCRYDPQESLEVRRHRSEAYYKHGGIAHTYEFHASILQVSKTIGHEAAEYLRTKAVFVLVTYKSPGFTAMLHRMDVPIVADRRVQRAYHDFAIKLRWNTNPFDSIHPKGKLGLKAPKRGAVLMLARDLPKLQAMLHFHCAFLAPKRVCLVQGHDPLVTAGGLSAFTPNVKLRARSEHHPYATAFLDGFQDITGIGYKLRVDGFGISKADFIQSLRSSLAPQVVWPRAQAWERLDVALQIKQHADQLVLAGELEAARARYQFLSSWFECDYFKSFRKINISQDSVLFAAVERWLILIFDCCISQSWLYLRLIPGLADASYPLYAQQLHKILKRIHAVTGSWSPALDPVWCHVILFTIICFLPKASKRRATKVCAMASRMIQLRHLWGALDVHETLDYALVQTAIHTHQLTGTFEVPFDRLSVRTLPVRIFDHQAQATSQVERPEDLVHWQDRVHLESLTEVESLAIEKAKKAISKSDLSI